jgi:hypothetical protein
MPNDIHEGSGIAFIRDGNDPIYGQVTAVSFGTVIWRAMTPDNGFYRMSEEVISSGDDLRRIYVIP